MGHGFVSCRHALQQVCHFEIVSWLVCLGLVAVIVCCGRVLPVRVGNALGYWKICCQKPRCGIKRVWDENVWRWDRWGTNARLSWGAISAAAAVCAAAAAAVSLGSRCIMVVIHTRSGIAR